MKDKQPGNRSRIILALDVDSILKATVLMDTVSDVQVVKIGMELINAQIAGAVSYTAIDKGYGVFWDDKLHDIPTTMGKAAKSVAQFGAKMLSVHGSSGIEGIRKVVEAAGSTTLVLVVTVLTSHDTENAELDFGASRNAKVLYFARQAVLAGADGIVCSPKELSFLAGYPETKDLIKVVPGTRSQGLDHHDQKNVTTPAEAILAGADWLVIGREITESKSPRDAAISINAAISEALLARESKEKGVVPA